MVTSTDARLHVLDAMSELLLDLADTDDIGKEELEDIKESMDEIAEMMLDMLHFEVVDQESTEDGLRLNVNIKITR